MENEEQPIFIEDDTIMFNFGNIAMKAKYKNEFGIFAVESNRSILEGVISLFASYGVEVRARDENVICYVGKARCYKCGRCRDCGRCIVCNTEVKRGEQIKIICPNCKSEKINFTLNKDPKGITQCKKCGSKNIFYSNFEVRTLDEKELICKRCGSKIDVSFSLKKRGISVRMKKIGALTG